MIGEWLISSGTRGLYHLENTTDSSGNGFTLTNNNSVTFTAGKLINAANFGSANTNKSLTVNNDMGITGGAISIAFWLKLLSEITTGVWYLLDHDDAETHVQDIIYYSYNAGNQLLRVDRTKRAVSNNPITINTGALGTNSWNHIVYTYDGTNLRGYLNGRQVGGDLATSGNGSGTTEVDKVVIGAGQDNTGVISNHASVMIDEVAIFNRKLTIKEIKDYYAWSMGLRTSVA